MSVPDRGPDASASPATPATQFAGHGPASDEKKAAISAGRNAVRDKYGNAKNLSKAEYGLREAGATGAAL